MIYIKLNNKEIMSALMATGKFSKVSFSKASKARNKWNVYLRPKSDPKGAHFHISYVDGGFITQDEITYPSRSYYNNWRTVHVPMAKTPLGAIRVVAQLLNEGFKVIKL